MSLAEVVEDGWKEVISRFEEAEASMQKEDWDAAIVRLAEVCGWKWPILGCSEELHMKLQDHLVWCFYKTKDYVKMEDWCRQFLKSREKPRDLPPAERASHDRRTRYLWRELASALQRQYDPDKTPPLGDIQKCLEATKLLQDHVQQFESGREDDLVAYNEVLAECFSKIGKHQEAIDLGKWILSHHVEKLGLLDHKVLMCRDNLIKYFLRSGNESEAALLVVDTFKAIDDDENADQLLLTSTAEYLDDLYESYQRRFCPSSEEYCEDESERLPVDIDGESIPPSSENPNTSPETSQSLVSEDTARNEENISQLTPMPDPERTENSIQTTINDSPVDADKATPPNSEEIPQCVEKTPEIASIPDSESTGKATQVTDTPHLPVEPINSTPPESEDTAPNTDKGAPDPLRASIPASEDTIKAAQTIDNSHFPIENHSPTQEDQSREIDAFVAGRTRRGGPSPDYNAMSAQAAPFPDESGAPTDLSSAGRNLSIAGSSLPPEESTNMPIPETPVNPSPAEENASEAKAAPLSETTAIIPAPESSNEKLNQYPPPVKISGPTPPPSPPHGSAELVETINDDTGQAAPTIPKEAQEAILESHLPAEQFSFPASPDQNAEFVPRYSGANNLPTPRTSIQSLDLTPTTTRPEEQTHLTGSSVATELAEPSFSKQDQEPLVPTQDISSPRPAQLETYPEDNISDLSDDYLEPELDKKNHLFGSELCGKGESDETREWLKKFTIFRETLFPVPYEGAGVKIAILDTGIDGEHPWIKNKDSAEERWKKPNYGKKIGDKEINLKPGEWYKDFVSKKPEAQQKPVDLDGHGTHVAGIIMQYAPDAELCIARITKSSSSIGQDKELAERVAEAIEHAVNFWGVDIISMSLCFHDLTRQQLARMDKAISLADGQRVILMAAASNHGNLGGIPFPARDHRVFPIHASNGLGSKLPFSPKPRKGSNNFSILGLDIMSIWPGFPRLQAESKRKKDSIDKGLDGTWKILSGTSVATPLAAALAALLFQYSRIYVEPNVKKDESQLECYSGLVSVFKEMSREDEAGVDSLVPWEGAGDVGRFRRYDTRMAGGVLKMAGILKDVLDIV